MSEGKHTPGPWDVPNIGYVRKDGALYPIAPSEKKKHGESWIDMRKRIEPELNAREEEALANARLIAAAPDLLEALEDAVRLIVEHVPDDALGYDSSGDIEEAHLTFSWSGKDEALHYLNAAIAKAKGEDNE